MRFSFYSLIIVIIVGSALVFAPLAIGGVHALSALILLLLGLVAWCVLLFKASRQKKSAPMLVSIPALGLWVFAGVCLLQVIPLPAYLIEFLSPNNARSFADGWQVVFPEAPSNIASSWRTLSLDPQRTAEHGLRWLTLGVFALVAANIGFSRQRWRALLWGVVGSGLIVWVVGLLQQIVETKKFLWFYEATIPLRTVSTFVNTNHAAVYYGIISIIAIYLAAVEHRKQPVYATLASVLGVLFFILAIEHNSDATALAYILGGGVFVALLFLRLPAIQGFWAQQKAKRSDSGDRIVLLKVWSFVVVAGCLAAGAILIGTGAWSAGSGEDTFGEWLEHKGALRWHLVDVMMGVWPEYALAGSGAGTTERIIYPLVDWSQWKSGTIKTIENEPVEWLVTMGIVPTLLFTIVSAIGIFWCARAAFGKQSRGYYLLLTLALFLAVVLHFQFPFHVLGIVVPVVIVFEYGYKRHRRICGGASRPGFGRARVIDWLRGSHIAFSPRVGWVLWSATVVVSATFAYGYYEVWNHVPEQIFSANAERQINTDTLEKLVRARPTDSTIYSYLAYYHADAGAGDHAVALAEHAYKLTPRSHQLLDVARITAHKGDIKQATQHYKKLFGKAFVDRQRVNWIYDFMLRDIRDGELRVQALSEAPGQWWLRAAKRIIELENSAQAAVFANALVEHYPQNPWAYYVGSHAFQALGEPLLAELWARRVLLMVEQDGQYQDAQYGDDLQAASMVQLARLLHAERKHAEMWQLLHDAMQANISNPNLEAWIFARKPADVQKASEQIIDTVTRAYDSFCRYPLAPRRLSRCWVTQAWLYEQSPEKMEKAEMILRRIYNRWHNPQMLSRFYARHQKCRELRGLLHDVEQNEEVSDSQKQRVQGVVERCGG